MEMLTKYETFKTKKEFSEFIHDILSTFEFSDSERKMILFLADRSTKYLGVSWMRVETIANEIGKDPRTVRRYFNKFQKLGFLRRIKQIRKKKKGYGASLTIFLPNLNLHSEDSVGDEKKEEGQDDYHLVPKEDPAMLIKKIISKDSLNDFLDFVKRFIHTRKEFTSADLLNVGVPQEFSTLLKSYHAPKAVFDLWKAVQRTMKKNHIVYSSKIVIPAIQFTISKFKEIVHKKHDAKFNWHACLCSSVVKQYNQHQENEVPVTQEKKKPIRTEKLPDWFESYQKNKKSAYNTLDDEHFDFEEEKRKLEEKLRKRKQAAQICTE